MIAKFNSTCPHCGNQIQAGVTEVSKRNGKWGHAKCPSTSSVSARIITGRTTTVHNFAPTSAMLSHMKQAIEDAPMAAAVSAVAEESFSPVDEQVVASRFQQAIFDWMETGSGHAVVEAVAGSGKTTTLVMALRYTPTNAAVAFCAFNKHIARELESRAPSHVRVGTLHSFGYAALRKALDLSRDCVDEMKVERIMDKYIPVHPEMHNLDKARARNKRSALRKLVSLCKAIMSDGLDGLLEIADRYGIEVSQEVRDVFPLVNPVLQDCQTLTATIDYDDMLWLPVVLGIPLPQYDWLFVDECQDLNKCQIQFVLRSVKPTGRVIAVGDRKQSLYGFRGADTEAVPNLIKALNATVLPLSICYRCPKSHIEKVKGIVPEIEARADAPEGTFAILSEDRLSDLIATGDMIICRVNAPLVPLAFSFIRRGMKAVLRGKDIGKGIIEFVKKFQAEDIDQLFSRMNEYKVREISRLERQEGKEMQIETLVDKCETVLAVAEECLSVPDLVRKLETLFSDDVEGVVLSSVHRAKGLQAKRVAILKPGLMPHPRAKDEWQVEQEWNCFYVAHTRSTSELYHIQEKKQ